MKIKKAYDELIGKLDSYYETFGSDFPTIPLMESRTQDEIIGMIDRCISEGKSVYALGYLPDPNQEPFGRI